MDLDDEELKATRESNGADRRGVGNIKILEEKINNIKKYDTYRYDWTETDVQTIEHLIKAYKELEEENKTLNERNQYLVKYRAKLEKELYESNENYIPVSLVEEKIEELKNKSGGNVFHIQQTINAEIRLLQELLEKR